MNCDYLKKKGSALEPVTSPQDILEKKFKKVLKVLKSIIIYSL